MNGAICVPASALIRVVQRGLTDILVDVKQVHAAIEILIQLLVIFYFHCLKARIHLSRKKLNSQTPYLSTWQREEGVNTAYLYEFLP